MANDAQSIESCMGERKLNSKLTKKDFGYLQLNNIFNFKALWEFKWQGENCHTQQISHKWVGLWGLKCHDEFWIMNPTIKCFQEEQKFVTKACLDFNCYRKSHILNKHSHQMSIDDAKKENILKWQINNSQQNVTCECTDKNLS